MQQVRLEREKVAIAEARRQGLQVLNRGKKTDEKIDNSSMQRLLLTSKERALQKELERVRAKLKKAT